MVQYILKRLNIGFCYGRCIFCFEGMVIMKKLVLCLMCITLMLFSFAFANENSNNDVNLLSFEPVGGGKFIYCNNPEPIEDDMILNGESPRYIMNNENLTPDSYYIYISHFNYTSGDGIGYDIELDMEMTAKEDSKITIHKAFFETPQNYGFYKNGIRNVAESDWGHLQVCADMLGIPMCDIRGEDFYYPRSYEPITLEVKKGEKIWLSEYLECYEAVKVGKGVHIQALISIDSGLMDFNVGAIKSNSGENVRESLPENIAFGEYRWDYTLKGIADSMPQTETNIKYIIDESTEDGERIPVFLKNQYIPSGHTVTQWYTQLNPQNDIWSKTTAAESDILPLYYRDDTKLNFYGLNIADSEKDNIWRFDTLHSALRKYEPRFNTGLESDFIPNFLLSVDTDNHEYACNIGNYGVAASYKMTVTNETDEVKYCSLVLTAASEIIAYESNANGEKNYAYVKDLTGEKITDNMLSHKIPPNSTEEFTFSLILPVNYNGGIKNELVITDKNIQTVNFEEKKAETEAEHKQAEYRITNEIYGEYLKEKFPLMLAETQRLFNGNKNSYEYLRGNNTGLIRFCAWDGAPEWYYNHWSDLTDTVYMADKDYNIISSFTFPSLPCAASYKDGEFYIKTARNGIYKSDNGAEWIKTDVIPEYVPYYDLENASEWAIPELERGWEEEIRLKWYGESYNFSVGISREAFCELAVNLLNKIKASDNISGEIEFIDTQNPHIKKLAALGIIKGFGDGTFRAMEELTREQAAVILERLARYAGMEDEDADRHIYADADSISDWAKSGVSFVYNIGVMHGTGDNMFEPQSTYSIEQSAVTMLRLYDCFAK